MGYNFNFSFGRNSSVKSVHQDGNSFFYSFLNSSKKKRLRDYNRLEFVMNSPAATRVIKKLADTFSLVKFQEYKGGVLENADFFKNIEKPNPSQSWANFFWEYAFWLALGNAYLYKENGFYIFLKPQGIRLTHEQQRKFKKLSFSKYGDSSYKNAFKGSFEYYNEYNEKKTFKLENLTVFQDFNGISKDLFCSYSRIDSLYEVIENSQLSLKSQGINLDFSGKYMISGSNDIGDVNNVPMGGAEKQSVEDSFLGAKKVHVTKSKVDVKQMVDNLDNFKFPDQYSKLLHVIGNMYDIPKDILEALEGKAQTYENQEKAMARFIDYTITPLTNELVAYLLKEFPEVEELRPSFAYLPFNKVFEIEKQKNISLKLDNIEKARDLGMKPNKVTELINSLYD